MNYLFYQISALLVILGFHNALSSKYPFTRYFKNSNLTFKSSESLLLEIEGDSVNYFFLADQGGFPTAPFFTPILTYTASLMSKIGPSNNTHFQFALGDNFYFDGVKSVDDPRFKTSFEDVFTDEHLLETPWFLNLGNHDYRGDVEANSTAQLEYTYISKRWILPNYLYDIDINLNSELLIKVLVIDTQKICDEGTESDRDLYLKQVDEKMNTFSKLNPPYFIVCGHYPVWSVGVTGSNECLITKIRPLLHLNKVDAYFSGHDHTMEHLSHEYFNSKVEFVVSGASNFADDSTPNMDSVPRDSLKFTWKTGENQSLTCKNCSGAFAFVTTTKEKMSFTYLNTKGENIYSNLTIYSKRSGSHKNTLSNL